MEPPPASPARLPLPHAVFGVLICLVGLPLLLVLLGVGDSTDPAELATLLAARDGYRAGSVRLLSPEQPPLPVLLTLGVSTIFHSDALWVVRLPAVLMGLTAALATYALGWRTTRDRRLSVIAALILLTMLAFLQAARRDSGAIYAAACSTLGALGFVAMPQNKRAVWPLLAGGGLGLAVLADGFSPAALVGLPLVLWLLLFYRRREVFFNLALAALTWLLTWGTWWLLLAGRSRCGLPENILMDDAAGSGVRPLSYALEFVAGVFPHVLLLPAALALPLWSPRDEESRLRWAWWLIVLPGFLALCLLPARRAADAAVLFPFLALLCAGVWQQLWRHTRPRALTVLLVLQLMIPLAGALLFLVLGIAQAWNWRRVLALFPQSIHRVFHETPPAFLLLAAAGLLIVLGVCCIRWRRGDVGRAAQWYVAAAAVLVFTLTFASGLAASRAENPLRARVEAALQNVGEAPLYTLPEFRPGLAARYYAERPLPVLAPVELEQIARANRPLYLLVREDPRWGQTAETIQKLTGRMLGQIAGFQDAQGKSNGLYVLQPIMP